MMNQLIYEPVELNETLFNVAIIGSGPAATAMAEYLYSERPDLKIVILERGDLLTTTHISNFLDGDFSMPPHMRDVKDLRMEFIQEHGSYPWAGDWQESGMMIHALGGRGIAAGAHLRRFDDADMYAWDNHHWPIGSEELSRHYTRAELVRGVQQGEYEGKAQAWLMGALSRLHPAPPPWGRSAKGYDSAASRLWALVHYDAMQREKRRLSLALNAYVTKLRPAQRDGYTVEFTDANYKSAASRYSLYAERVILAASPIESAKLCLNSNLGNGFVGRYLSEHTYCRGTALVKTKLGVTRGWGANVIVPPSTNEQNGRYQIELRGVGSMHDEMILRVTGIGALDPDPDNRVTLSDQLDIYGVPKAKIAFHYTAEDTKRNVNMRIKMGVVLDELNGVWQEQPVFMEPGRSHHETGTLRMSTTPDKGATNRYGELWGAPGLYACDASLFPTSGIANPMLTVAALAYYVAANLN